MASSNCFCYAVFFRTFPPFFWTYHKRFFSKYKVAFIFLQCWQNNANILPVFVDETFCNLLLEDINKSSGLSTSTSKLKDLFTKYKQFPYVQKYIQKYIKVEEIMNNGWRVFEGNWPSSRPRTKIVCVLGLVNILTTNTFSWRLLNLLLTWIRL